MTDSPPSRPGVDSPTSSDEKQVGFNRSDSAVYMTPEEAELARLGYKQEFKREFSWISTFSFAFSISGLLATVPPFKAKFNRKVTTTWGFPLAAGGPPAAVWCWYVSE